MYATAFDLYPLLIHPEVRNLRVCKLRRVFPENTFEVNQFDSGQVITVRGRGLKMFSPIFATAEDADTYSAAGLAFCKMHEAGLTTEAILSIVLER